jgi:hypothetical protein
MAIHGMNHFNVLTDRLEDSPCGAKVELDFAPDEAPPPGP